MELLIQDDTLAINLNYGLTHNKNTITEETNGPLLYTRIENTSLTSGDTAAISINFGTDTAIVDNLYGLAFSLELDTSLVEISTLRVDFETSWLGDKSQDMITLVKPFYNGNQVDIALTRTDLLNQTGYGQLAQMIIMIDDLSGKNEVEETLKVEVTNVRAFTCHQNLVDYSLGSDSILISDEPNSIENTDWEGLEIYPNPAREQTKINLTHTKPTTVRMTDMNGKKIWVSDEFRGELIIPTAKIASGVYLLQIATEDSQTTRKLVVKH